MHQVFISLGLSLVLTLLVGPLLIPLLHKLKFGQSIRTEGPKEHYRKAGTPTMGGLMFLVAIPVTTVILTARSWEILLVLWVTLGYGLIGFLDDFIKVVLKRSLGLTARQKLAGQFVVSLGLAGGATYLLHLKPVLDIPFTSYSWNIGLIPFILFTVFLTIGTTNAVNLTDGLDGLAAGVTVFAAAAFGVISWRTGHPDLAVFMAAVVGGCLGFLRYNLHPAKVFMGDTGSLALGGALIAVSVVTGTQFFLAIIGGVYIMETLSVIIQVISFKLTGKRVFRMSPLHHHFELSGWSETRVVRVFWLCSLVLALVGVMGLYNLV